MIEMLTHKMPMMMTKNVRNVWTGAGRSPNLLVMSESGALIWDGMEHYGMVQWGGIS